MFLLCSCEVVAGVVAGLARIKSLEKNVQINIRNTSGLRPVSH